MIVLVVTALIFFLQIKPPFLPIVEDEEDFSNFDADFTSQDPMITPPDSK